MDDAGSCHCGESDVVEACRTVKINHVRHTGEIASADRIRTDEREIG